MSTLENRCVLKTEKKQVSCVLDGERAHIRSTWTDVSMDRVDFPFGLHHKALSNP